jgi:hypothetical protein
MVAIQEVDRVRSLGVYSVEVQHRERWLDHNPVRTGYR